MATKKSIPAFVPTDLMVDLETLGTRADGVILSIGAVKFNLKTGEVAKDGFYASVSIDSNLEFGRRIQEDTLIWWLKRSVSAQSVFHEEKMALPEALVQFSDWVQTTELTVWANGPDFDTAMLAHAFAQQHMGTPWEFWASRCVRTYKGLPGAKAVWDSTPFEGTKHNALADAFHQAKGVCAIHRALFTAKETA